MNIDEMRSWTVARLREIADKMESDAAYVQSITESRRTHFPWYALSTARLNIQEPDGGGCECVIHFPAPVRFGG